MEEYSILFLILCVCVHWRIIHTIIYIHHNVLWKVHMCMRVSVCVHAHVIPGLHLRSHTDQTCWLWVTAGAQWGRTHSENSSEGLLSSVRGPPTLQMRILPRAKGGGWAMTHDSKCWLWTARLSICRNCNKNSRSLTLIPVELGCTFVKKHCPVVSTHFTV